jgi:hypothetical protein
MIVKKGVVQPRGASYPQTAKETKEGQCLSAVLCLPIDFL